MKSAIATCLAAPLLLVEPALGDQSPGDWKTLFNGRDFTGWTILASAARGNSGAPVSTNPAERNWKIEDGAISSVPPAPGQRGGSLATVDSFRDVELEFEFLLTEAGTKCTPRLGDKQVNLSEDRACAFNSGVYLRNGYQLNLGRREAGEYIGIVIHRTDPEAVRGNVLWLSSGDCGGRRGYVEDCDRFPAIRKAGAWNHVRISFRGPRLQAWLNGTQIVDVTDDPASPDEASWKEAAPIWFQFPPAGESGGFAGSIKYRNIRARDLVSRQPSREARDATTNSPRGRSDPGAGTDRPEPARSRRSDNPRVHVRDSVRAESHRRHERRDVYQNDRT